MMDDLVHVSDCDFCPDCETSWSYEVNGKRYSHLIGREPVLA